MDKTITFQNEMRWTFTLKRRLNKKTYFCNETRKPIAFQKRRETDNCRLELNLRREEPFKENPDKKRALQIEIHQQVALKNNYLRKWFY